ncbi:MAG: HD-GYP domain-containing protein, partial [Solirubrobacteraceae bacterium]
MAVQSEIGLIDELVRLRAELRRREREAADKELQLQRYAADLRETFKQERARAQELRRSYMATVRALSNAVEARDAYTGKHAERVAAYGLEIARKFPEELILTPELEFGFLLHDVGKVAIPDAILYKP